MKRIEKDWTELDWEKVDFTYETGNWGWSCGGAPHSDNEWSIYYVDEDLNTVRYKMPDCINHMLETQEKQGRDDLQRKLQRLLGI